MDIYWLCMSLENVDKFSFLLSALLKSEGKVLSSWNGSSSVAVVVMAEAYALAYGKRLSFQFSSKKLISPYTASSLSAEMSASNT
jgi:phosphoheptose isomerase